MIISKRKITVLIFASILVLYFVLLPALWPKPRILVNFPANSRPMRDMEVIVTVMSWHSNVSLRTVDATIAVDKEKNNGQSIISDSLLKSSVNKSWDSDHTSGINRFSWPREYTYKYALPIKKLSDMGLLKSEWIEGRIYAVVRYPDVSPFGFIITKRISCQTKFRIKNKQIGLRSGVS